MLAVLAPGLREGFESLRQSAFVLPVEILPDRVELGEIERERAPSLAGLRVTDPLLSQPCEILDPG